MGFITVGDENSTPIELYYEDQGAGQPIVLIHGYPLNGHSWERQTRELLADGYRVITYDRRGFGKSSQGRDRIRLRHVRRRPQHAHGDPRPSRRRPRRLLDGHRRARPLRLAARPRACREAGVPRLAGALPPRPRRQPRWACRRRSSTASRQPLAGDRYAWYSEFFANFYNLDENLGQRISQEAVSASWNVAVSSAPVAAYAVVSSWIEDFRGDVDAVRDSGQARAHPARDGGQHPPHRRHGATVPRSVLPDATYVEIEGAPHGLLWTHADDVNAALRTFLG